MNVVTIGIGGMDEIQRRAAAAFRGELQGEFITFASVDLLWRLLTPKRWDIVQAMTGRDAMSVRAIARLVDRDVKMVHADVQALLQAGVLHKGEDGRISFPYDAVHVDFMIRKAA